MRELSLPPIPSEESTFADDQVDGEVDLEEEQAGEDEEQVVMGAFCSILEFAYDTVT